MKMSVKSFSLVLTICWLVISCECGSGGGGGGDNNNNSNNNITNNNKQKFKILGLFGHLGQSHFDFFLPLLEELAKRGHELTVVSYFPRKEKLPNYKDISLVDSTGIFVNVVDISLLDHSVFEIISELKLIHSFAELACHATFEKPGVQELIKSDEKFDLIITELFNADCLLGFVHKFKVPYIGLSSHDIVPWANHRLMNPDNPSYIPNIFGNYPPEMTFFQRVLNTVTLITANTAYDLFFTGPMQALAEKNFGPDLPPLKELANNISALLVNSHFSIHGSRPYSQGVVEVGGLHIRDNKPLPKKIQDFLDSSKDQGVLYFNWGSMVKVSSLPKEKLDIVIKTLSSLKENVLWKWEDEELPNKPKNIMTQKWLPQFDILSHPNVKGFLTHGGLLGLSEAIHHGVPMVLVPMFGDQFHNSAAIASRGAGIVLQYTDMDEKSLKNALTEIMNNSSYRKNAQTVSEAYRDRPASALETAVWWTEHIARGKSLPFLRSASANLSWFQYHLLDVIAFVSLVILVFLLVVVFIIKYLLKSFFGDKKSSNKIQKTNVTKKNGIDKKRN